MKRSLALLLTVMMLVCFIPSSLITTVLAVDPAFKPNGIRNQTFDDAYNQYIPETVTVDGKLDDTAWAYEDWNNVTTETGTWNKDFTNIGVNVYDYSYQYQFKTDYEYFYGAIKLNRQFYGDIVIWLNDGRWEYCTDRVVINPTKLDLYTKTAESTDTEYLPYNAGYKLNDAKLKEAVRIERNITSVLHDNNSLGDTGFKVYETNAAGAFYPGMKYPNYNGNDWVNVWEDLDNFSYPAEKTQYVIKQEGDAIIIEFRLYAYAFEHGKIEQDGSIQEEDYNPNYSYYVSAGVGTDANSNYAKVGYCRTKVYEKDSDGNYTDTQVTFDKVYYDKVGEDYQVNETLTKRGMLKYADHYYCFDDHSNGEGECSQDRRAALYYPRLNVKDSKDRMNYIPGINKWPERDGDPSLQGLKLEVMKAVEKNDFLVNEKSDAQMVVDGEFAEDIWSPLTNYHVNGDQSTKLDISRVLYSVPDLTDNFTAKQSAFKMEIRYDDGDTEDNISDDWLYGAAIAYNAGGTVPPTLIVKFHRDNSTLDDGSANILAQDHIILTIGSETVTSNTLTATVTEQIDDNTRETKEDENWEVSDGDVWAKRQKNDETGLWQYEFKIKVDGNVPLKGDGNNWILYNAFLNTDKPSGENKLVKGCRNSTLIYNTTETIGDDYHRYYIKNNYYTKTFASNVVPDKKLECNIENVIFDGKVDEFDWAALCAFDNVVSGQYQNDYVYTPGTKGENSNPIGRENAVESSTNAGKTATTERDVASFHKLTSDGEYLYGGVLVQFGEGSDDYWHTAKAPSQYKFTADDGNQYPLASGTAAHQAKYEGFLKSTDVDLYRIWINNNPEHTNSLEREGATAILNIAIINIGGTYYGYFFVDNQLKSDADWNKDGHVSVSNVKTDGDGKIKSFALEFGVSLYALDLKQTQDYGLFNAEGKNVGGKYNIDYDADNKIYYNDRGNTKYAVYEVDSDDTDDNLDIAIYENGFPGDKSSDGSRTYPKIAIEYDKDGNITYQFGVTVYYDGTVKYIILNAYEHYREYKDVFVTTDDYNGYRECQGVDAGLLIEENFVRNNSLSGKKYIYEEFTYSSTGIDNSYFNHVDYTQSTYFNYFVSIENGLDISKWETAEKTETQTKITDLKYGRLISVHSEDPLAVDAWTGHVYATYQNTTDKKWWRRNFFNVHVAHTFGYEDMLDNCVVDGKLEEHMWHRNEDDSRNMTLVTPTTGVWETTPTQNEVYQYTYRVWTDGNYIYGGAWLGDEIFKGQNENDSDHCTKLELYFKNTLTNNLYYFDMYFRDDDEIVGTYQINGDEGTKKITGGLTDMLFQKTITYANGECYFEFRIDLRQVGCGYSSTYNSTYWINQIYGNQCTNQYSGYESLQYHVGMTQPCQTGAAYEVLTLFADNFKETITVNAGTENEKTYNVGDPYELVREGNLITWGTLNDAIHAQKLNADYSTATMPAILAWDATDALLVDQMEHFAGEKIRVDGTLNDTGWAEHRWLEVKNDVNGSEDIIYDDLNNLNYTYMVRADSEYLYVSAVIDVEFNASTKPEFYFWILDSGADENTKSVRYIKLSYGSTVGEAGNYEPAPRNFDNSELYDVYDIDDLVNAFANEKDCGTVEYNKLSELSGRGSSYVYNQGYFDELATKNKNKYIYETADKTVDFDEENNKISFSTVKIDTYGIENPFNSGLYGYSEVIQEMNQYFDIVNFGQVVGKEHALMQSANGVMINDRAGKKTETVVEFRVKRSEIDPNLNGFQYAVQATATFNGQKYDLVYPYVDNKVGERREMDDYNFPNEKQYTVWQENAVTVNDSVFNEKYRLRNNTNSVVTLGAKANMSFDIENCVDDGIADNNSIRFGSMYTENYIRNNVYMHTVKGLTDDTGDVLFKDGYDADGKSNVEIDLYNAAIRDVTTQREEGYYYWDTTKLGNIILPTWMLEEGERLNYYSDPTISYLPATSIVTWKGDYEAGREINFADYESFQFYSAITDIPDEWTWIKYSFAAVNGFDYVDKTTEYDIGDGEHKVYRYDNGETFIDHTLREDRPSFVKLDANGVYTKGYTKPEPAEGAKLIYEGYGVTVDYYYDAVLERSPYMINYVTKGTEEDGDDSSNEESILPGNLNEGDYNDTKVAYIPLDNRPVNVQRVQYLAEASGFDLIMPEEDLYRTATYSQSKNSNGNKYGNREDLVTWLREIEDSENVDYYIISLDQLFFGGLAEAASSTEAVGAAKNTYTPLDAANNDLIGRFDTEMSAFDKELLELLRELADANYVYYYTAVTPTVGLDNYAKDNNSATWWADDAFRKGVADYTEKAFTDVDFDTTKDYVNDVELDQTVDYSGNTYAYYLDKNVALPELNKVLGQYSLDGMSASFTEPNMYRLAQILRTREYKMRLITEILSTFEYGAIEHLVFGVDDVYFNNTTTDKTIQANEIAYIELCINALNGTFENREDYQIAYGVDQLGLAGISALTTDLYATQREYFTKIPESGAELDKDFTKLTANTNKFSDLEGVDVVVEYITDKAPGTNMDSTYYFADSVASANITDKMTKCTAIAHNGISYDELITSAIEIAGGRRVSAKGDIGQATLTLLVMLPTDDASKDQLAKNFVTRAVRQLDVNAPVAMVDFGEYGMVNDILSGTTKGVKYDNSTGKLTDGVVTIGNPGRFLATYTYNKHHAYRSNPAHAVGVSISNAISRYSYLIGKRQTVDSHEGAYKVIAYSMINDISYGGNFNMDMDGEIYEGVHKETIDQTYVDANGVTQTYHRDPIVYDSNGQYIDTPIRHYSGLVKYANETGVTKTPLLKKYSPQEVMKLVNKSKITVMVDPDYVPGESDSTRYQNMANVMIGNARNPLDRPHELTFDVAVVENDADNIARNKREDGTYIRNRSSTGTYYQDFYKYFYEKIGAPTSVGTDGKTYYDLTGYNYKVSGVPMGQKVTLPTTNDAGGVDNENPDRSNPYYTYNKQDYYTTISTDGDHGKYTYTENGKEKTKNYVAGDLNYVVSVTNNYYADDERESVVNYKFSYGAELTDGLAYNYLEYRGKTHDEMASTQIGAFTSASGYSNNGWFAFEQDYNCHYAGNDKYFGYVVVNLKQMSDIGAVRLHLLNYDNAEVHEPTEIRLLTSEDGTHFTYIDSFYTRDDSESIDAYWSMLDAKGMRGQYVKIEFIMGGKYALLNEIEVYAQDTQTIRVGTYNIAHGIEAQKVAKLLGATTDTAIIEKSLDLIADDINAADLDVVILNEVALHAHGYQGGVIDFLKRETGFKNAYLIRMGHYHNRMSDYKDENNKGTSVYHKMAGSVILTDYDLHTSSKVATEEIYTESTLESAESNILAAYNINENNMNVTNYNLVVLNVPANGTTMPVPIFAAHCNPQTIAKKVLPFVKDGDKFYDNLIVAGDFNNPTFTPLHQEFKGMKLTVNDTNKLITFHQGKSMDNIIYTEDDYSLVGSGTVQSGNSDHYLVWAELEYYEWIK